MVATPVRTVEMLDQCETNKVLMDTTVLSSMHYLIATDGSSQGDDAVSYAARQAVAFEADLELVHVLTPRTQSVNGEAVFEGAEETAETGENILEQARDIVLETVGDRATDVGVETQLLTGRPAHAIADYAAEIDADAIYIGHRGLSSERQKMVGSVAKGVVDEADVPVTVVR